MAKIMGIINLTPDSFYEPSRYNFSILDSDADIVDIGAVSTRPGYTEIPMEEEWERLEPFLKSLRTEKTISIDTTRAEIVRRAYDITGPFIINDISAGEDDVEMLPLAGRLALPFIAMHRYPSSRDISAYFREFEAKAEVFGIENWILDPGFGFNKDEKENMHILERLEEFKSFNRPVLVGVADKRFTRTAFGSADGIDGTEAAHLLALRHGADILRVHDVKKARRTVRLFENSAI